LRLQNVAVLFAEIIGFPRMAKRMTPEAVVALLRQPHQRITAQIFACGGSVEKNISDEIVAVFGIPEPAARTRPTRCVAPNG
jgi:adenylate cyclase